MFAIAYLYLSFTIVLFLYDIPSLHAIVSLDLSQIYMGFIDSLLENTSQFFAQPLYKILFGPRVYLKGFLVIALVRVCVRVSVCL